MAKMTAVFQPLINFIQKSTFWTFFFFGVYSEHRNSVEKNLRACFLLATCLEKLWKLVELSFHPYIRSKVSCMEGEIAKMTAFFQPLVENFQKSTFSTFSFSGVYSEHRNSVEKILRACFLLATCLKISPKLYETRWDIRYVFRSAGSRLKWTSID